MTADYIDNYYSRTLHNNQKRPALDETTEAAVCVIGGGLAGLSTALSLLEKGMKNVVVLEANRIGWGASGRNGGFVAKGYACGYRQLVKQVGLDHTKTLHKQAVMGRALIRKRINDYKIDCGPVVDGVLGVSWNDNREAVEEYIDFMSNDLGAPLEFMPRDQVRELCKTTRYYDGFFSPDDYQFHPLNYVHGLAQTIEDKGGRIFENTKALLISDHGNGHKVQTPQGAVLADQIVLACSIYIDKSLDSKLSRAAFPVMTYVMVTKPLPEDKLKTAINTNYAIFDNRFAQDYYRVLPDHRILWGGRVNLWQKPARLAETMIRDLLKVYPQLQGYAEPDIAWSGLLCYAPHRMPQLGQKKPGYWFCTCFGGHGLVPTATGGELIAAAIAENDDRYKLFSPFGLNYFGGKLGRYAAQFAYASWRFRDVLRALGS